MTTIDEAFSQLRSILQRKVSSENILEIIELVGTASLISAPIVKEQWFPYIDHYIHNFQKNYPPYAYIDMYSWDWCDFDPIFHLTTTMLNQAGESLFTNQIRYIQSLPVEKIELEDQIEWLGEHEMPFLRHIHEIDEKETRWLTFMNALLNGKNAQYIQSINADNLAFDQLVELIRALPHTLPKIHSVTLQSSNLTEDNIENLDVLFEKMPALARLDLRDNEFGDEGIVKLVKTSLWQRLTHLGLNNVEIGNTGLRKIIHQPKQIPLSYLALNNNVDITPAAVAEMAQSNAMLDIQCLDLSDIIDADGIAHLVTIPFRKLRRIHLAQMPMTEEAMTQLGHWPSLNTVEHLSLYKSMQTTRCLAALFKPGNVTNLRFLDLDENDISLTTLRTLKSKYMQNLICLELGSMHLNVEKLNELLSVKRFPSLKYVITDMEGLDPRFITQLKPADEAYLGKF